MRLKTERILEEWSQLLPGCAGEAPRILADIQRQLEASNAPFMTWREESLASGFLIGALGRRRDCVRIRHAKFTEVVVLAGAHDHGADLLAFWLAAATPRVLGRIRRSLRFGLGSDKRHELGAEFDVVEAWSLGAYLETTRAAVHGAIADLMRERPRSRRPRARL